MWRKSHRLVVAVATKTVINEQSSTGTKQINFRDRQKSYTAAHKEKRSLLINFNTTNSRVRKLQKSQKKFSESKSEKTDSRKEMSEKFNRSYNWWSETTEESRDDKKEESILDPKWNRSLSNTNELSEEEEVSETLQRTRKII